MHASRCDRNYSLRSNSINIHGNELNFATRESLRVLNKNITSPKIYEVPGAQGGPRRISSPGGLCLFRSGSFSEIVTPVILTLTMLKVSEVPGAQGGPLLLEFHANYIRNRSKTMTRSILTLLNTNMTTVRVCEVSGIQGGPLLQLLTQNSWSFMLNSFGFERKSLLRSF